MGRSTGELGGGAAPAARAVEPAVGRRRVLDQARVRLDRRGIAMWLPRRVMAR
ncbi:MAG: hypothetical protein HYX55_10175 [Chloroflexi bacterium]|nr:hypothetical protein [Chloroflexota bacterium]